jgi:D-alanyl-D-alanine endopeptidase (penicillin-binding protein 7)
MLKTTVLTCVLGASLMPLGLQAQVTVDLRAVLAEPVHVKELTHAEPLPAPVELKAQPALFRAGAAELIPLASEEALDLKSAAAIVVDQEGGQLLYAKNTGAVMPIASITKLMTAMVILDSGLPLEERITISRLDMDTLKGTRSRLRLGVTLPRRELLRLALMASENRAAAALARSYPGGAKAFVAAMNEKAKQLGMRDTRFVDATGLNPNNVATALDLAVLVNAGYTYPLIRDYTTTESVRLALNGSRRKGMLAFRNSNGLVRSGDWQIGLSKTGYISEAGRCLVMQARIATKPVIIVLLDSWGKLSRIGDANRIRRWMETLEVAAPSRPPRMS